MGITPRSGLEGSSARPIRANVPPMGRRAKEPHLTKTNRLPMQRQTPAILRRRMLRRERRLYRVRRGFLVVLDLARVAERDLPAPPVVVLVPEVRDMAGLVRIVRRAWIRRERKKACVRVRARMPLVRRWVRVRRARRWLKAKREPKVVTVRRDSTEVRDPIAARVPIEVHARIEVRDLIAARVPKVRAVIVRRDPKVPPPVVIVRRDSTEVRVLIAARVPIEVRDRIIEVRDPINAMVRSKRPSRPRREASFLRPNLRHRSKQSLPSWFRRPNLRRRPSRLRPS